MVRSFRQLGAINQRPAPAPATRRLRFRPRVESLEDRCVPAVFFVTNTDDNGDNSLRDAITRANASPNVSDPIDVIRFAGAGAAGTIYLASALPALGGPTAIEGPGAYGLAVKRSPTFGPFRIESNPVPTKTNPLGVKGAGEAGCVGAMPAVANALVDALSGLGIRHV